MQNEVVEVEVSPELILQKKLKPMPIPTNAKNRPIGYRWSFQKKIENMWEKIDKGLRVRCRFCLNERSKLESQKFLRYKKIKKHCSPEFPSNIIGEDFDCSLIEKRADDIAFSIIKLPKVVSV